MKLSHLLFHRRGSAAISDPEITSALNLSETQKLRLDEVKRQNRESIKQRFRQFLRGGRGPARVRDALEAVRRDSEDRLVSLLRDDQRAKLESLRGNE